MINKLDKEISKGIYNAVNSNKVTQKIPFFLGLLPYELYVIPGMYLAILQTIWFNSPNPVQFHLLPHYFAYSIFQFLKGTIKRGRPGCVDKKLSTYIDASHCSNSHSMQSFPSGHTGVSFSLATALFMEMMRSEDPRFFELKISSNITRKVIAITGFFVASLVSIQRISKGYHHFGDCVIGAILGSTIGYISWKALNVYKKKYYNMCKKDTENEDCDSYNNETKNKFIDFNFIKNSYFDENGKMKFYIIIIKLFLSIFILYLVHIFFTKTIFKLTSVKH